MVVFNPRCRRSPDLSHASFLALPDQTTTAKHLERIFAIVSSLVSTDPLNEFIFYHLSLKSQPAGYQNAILPVYESNLRCLSNKLGLESLISTEKSHTQAIERAQTQIIAEKNKEEMATAKKSRILAEIIAMEQDLENLRNLTSSVLREQAQENATRRSQQGQAWGGYGTSAQQRPRNQEVLAD